MNEISLGSQTVAFYTLGCKLNFAETSAIGRDLEANGYTKVPFEKGADIYVINTCSVTDHADKKCRKVVQQALKSNPKASVVVVGCYAQLKPDEIASIPGVSLVLGAQQKFNVRDFLNRTDGQKVFAGNIEDVNQFASSYSHGDRTRTFLKVQDGCNYGCAFCTIPLARGRSRSAPIEGIVKQAYEIAEKGVKEIVLTGVNIGDYGLTGEEGNKFRQHGQFLDLIRELDKVETIHRFRISSIEPNLLTNEVIQFVSQSQRFSPHFHVPLQSGTDKILRLMRRRYMRSLYAERVETIKRLMPHACIGVDVIVGFPGETDEDFKETYAFLNDLDISYLHVFTYSERPNTHAIHMPGAVHGSVRHERNTMLHSLSDKKRRAFYETQLGRTVPVLFEHEKHDQFMYGFSDNYVKVRMPYDPMMVNEIVDFKLKEFNSEGTIEGYQMIKTPSV
jgi:threonylcarbamoyladenosine tRNA methylthiotransferase MtaB